MCILYSIKICNIFLTTIIVVVIIIIINSNSNT